MNVVVPEWDQRPGVEVEWGDVLCIKHIKLMFLLDYSHTYLLFLSVNSKLAVSSLEQTQGVIFLPFPPNNFLCRRHFSDLLPNLIF